MEKAELINFALVKEVMVEVTSRICRLWERIQEEQ